MQGGHGAGYIRMADQFKRPRRNGIHVKVDEKTSTSHRPGGDQRRTGKSTIVPAWQERRSREAIRWR